MTDIVDPATRSRMMAGIRGKNTQPELKLRRLLHAKGFRFRIHDKRLPGKPDIVLPKWKAAIQVHGCFWHRHEGCRFATTPATRQAFWQDKFDANMRRDQDNVSRLQKTGWRSAVVWECAIRKCDMDSLLTSLCAWIIDGDRSIELPLPGSSGHSGRHFLSVEDISRS